MYVSLAFAGFLLLCALGLMAWHIRSWNADKRRKVEPAERQFRALQYRRRMQTSILMAILATMLPAGQWIMIQADEAGDLHGWWLKAGVAFIGVVLLLLCWIGLLALSDFVATRMFYGRLRDRCQLEQTRLQAELRKLQKVQRNGATGASQSKEPEVPDSESEKKSN